MNVPNHTYIFVDGPCEVAGNIRDGGVAGTVTIGCSGDMYLIDDVQYVGTDRYGRLDPDSGLQNMLGLASEQNIIIADSYQNGKANGAGVAPNDLNRHSIIINAALVTLGGSFTFEHHNNDWEPYQGPTPDERGTIYLNGSLAQYRRGYVHRSNHDGTGYGKCYRFDPRLANMRVVDTYIGENPYITGEHYNVYLGENESYTIHNATINNLVIERGVEVELQNSVWIRNQLIVEGTSEEPVTIRTPGYNRYGQIRVTRGANSMVSLSNLQLEGNIETIIEADTIRANECTFTGHAMWSGTMDIDACEFHREADFTAFNELIVSRCLFTNGMELSGYTDDGLIVNNTFVNGRNHGLRLNRFQQCQVVNNIFASNWIGIHNRSGREFESRYNCVFDNHTDYLDCDPGVGSITANPQFVDAERGNNRLLWGSPCIDGGDPELPPDPDGTRSDIGAFFFDQDDPDAVKESEDHPLVFSLNAPFPNPFNATTTIEFSLTREGHVQLQVLDLNGKVVAYLVERSYSSGSHKVVFNAGDMPAGVYLVKLSAGMFTDMKKVILVR